MKRTFPAQQNENNMWARFARLASLQVAGPVFVGIGALLWATDALVRYPAAEALDPVRIVYLEHVIGLILLLPIVLIGYGKRTFQMPSADWFAAVLVGCIGSALGTSWFTASFQYLNPSVAILIQKLQPLLVVIMAHLVLKEKPTRGFYGWALVAFLSALVLSFPDLNFSFLRNRDDVHLKGLVLACGATVAWGFSTVAGKALLKRQPAAISTFWRFFFATVLLVVLSRAPSGYPLGISGLSGKSLAFVFYLATVVGVIPMFIYYAGLRRTSASIATFVELLYPVGGVLLNWIFLGSVLTPVQGIAGLVLLVAVTCISVRLE